MTGDFRNFESRERSFLGRYRRNLSRAENPADLDRQFSQSVSAFLYDIFDGRVPIGPDDVTLRMEGDTAYRLSPRLMSSAVFRENWKHSNLPAFLEKVSDAARHRHRHLDGNRHGVRTDARFGR